MEGGSGGVGDGAGWRAQGRVHHTLEQKISHCIFMEVWKGLRCACQVEIIIGSNFTPSAALLACPMGTMHPIVDCHESPRSQM